MFNRKNDYDLNNFPKMNDSSIAICLNCYGNKILLAGDSTLTQWKEHKRQMNRDNISNLNVNCLKVPHHGSKYDNDEFVYDYFFDIRENKKNKYVFVSANGTTHPDRELFDLIEKFDLIPYCTNFSNHCLPPNVIQWKPMTEIPKSMHPFLLNYAEKTPNQCQGDILLNINELGINIKNSTGLPCVYRTK